MKTFDVSVLRKTIIDNSVPKAGQPKLVGINETYSSDKVPTGNVMPVYESVEEFNLFNPNIYNLVQKEIAKRENEGDPGFAQDRMGREAYEEKLEEMFEKKVKAEVAKAKKEAVSEAELMDPQKVEDLFLIRYEDRLYGFLDTVDYAFASEALAKECAKKLNNPQKPFVKPEKDLYYVQSVLELLNAKGGMGE